MSEPSVENCNKCVIRAICDISEATEVEDDEAARLNRVTDAVIAHRIVAGVNPLGTSGMLVQHGGDDAMAAVIHALVEERAKRGINGGNESEATAIGEDPLGAVKRPTVDYAGNA